MSAPPGAIFCSSSSISMLTISFFNSVFIVCSVLSFETTHISSINALSDRRRPWKYGGRQIFLSWIGSPIKRRTYEQRKFC